VREHSEHAEDGEHDQDDQDYRDGAVKAAAVPVEQYEDDEQDDAAPSAGPDEDGHLPASLWVRASSARTMRTARSTVREPVRWRRFLPLHSGQTGALRRPLRCRLPRPPQRQHLPNGLRYSDRTRRGDREGDEDAVGDHRSALRQGR
jgi:hypothetical protein